LTRANGDRFRKMVLSRGNTEDLAKMYADWRGAPPNTKAMLKHRGLEGAGRGREDLNQVSAESVNHGYTGCTGETGINRSLPERNRAQRAREPREWHLRNLQLVTTFATY